MTGERTAALPTISIVTTARNQGHFIVEAIESARHQLGPDDEHIVIDGASTDGTQEILARYPHIRWMSEPDRGQTDGLFKGFRMARGDVIGWLNADDTYEPRTLDVVRRFFVEHPEIGLTYGYVYIIDEHSRRVRRRYTPDFDFGMMVRNGRCYAQPTFFFRREPLERMGYGDPSWQWTLDYDLIIRFGLNYGVRKIPRFLGSFRTHSESKSHSGFASPPLRAEDRAIQSKYMGRLSHRWPSPVYRTHDFVVHNAFKLWGRVVSIPMYVRWLLQRR